MNEYIPPTRKVLRNFALTTGSFIVILFGLFFPLVKERAMPIWPWCVMVILWSWGVLFPASLKTPYKFWMAIGYGVGWINSRIILSITYYLFILPIGVARRLIGIDPMARKIERNLDTYKVISQIRTKKHFERPF